MVISVSITTPWSYAAGGPEANRPSIFDVQQVAYQVAHEYKGGLKKLAAELGMAVGTLQNKLNPNNETHHLHMDEAIRLMEITNNAAILHAMAAALDHNCVRQVRRRDVLPPIQAMALFQQAVADFTAAYADPMERVEVPVHGPMTPITTNEINRVVSRAALLMEAMGDMMATTRSLSRTPPKTEGQ